MKLAGAKGVDAGHAPRMLSPRISAPPAQAKPCPPATTRGCCVASPNASPADRRRKCYSLHTARRSCSRPWPPSARCFAMARLASCWLCELHREGSRCGGSASRSAALRLRISKARGVNRSGALPAGDPLVAGGVGLGILNPGDQIGRVESELGALGSGANCFVGPAVALRSSSISRSKALSWWRLMAESARRCSAGQGPWRSGHRR